MTIKKSALFFLVTLSSLTTSHGQSGNEALQQYQVTIAAINTVGYHVQRIDTFPSGSVWNHQGRGIMQRDAQSKLLKARFLGSRFDVHNSYLYDGNVGFMLDDSTKTYEADADPYLLGVLGGAGGQMLVPELFAIDPTYQAATYSRSAQGPVITLHYPDLPAVDVRDRRTSLILDEQTGLPKIVQTAEQKAGGRMITTKILSGLRVNDPADARALDSKTVLATYSAEAPTTAAAPPTLLGKPAPDFRLTGLDKKPTALSNYRGKVVLLDMWTTSCSPCISSMPKVQHLQDQYKTKGLVVIGVLMDAGNATRAQGILQRQGAAYTNLLGTENVESAYHVDSYPRYVLVGRDGKVAFDAVSYNDQMEAAIRTALQK